LFSKILKMTHIGVILCRESIGSLPKLENASLTLIQGNKVCIEAEIQYILISLNYGQGSLFKLREYAQSISRIKLPIYGSFLEFLKKNFESKKHKKSPRFLFFFRYTLYPVIQHNLLPKKVEYPSEFKRFSHAVFCDCSE
jgi:hypothetical protein